MPFNKTLKDKDGFYMYVNNLGINMLSTKKSRLAFYVLCFLDCKASGVLTNGFFFGGGVWGGYMSTH